MTSEPKDNNFVFYVDNLLKSNVKKCSVIEMASYKMLSIIQSVIIFICAISLFDYGYSISHVLSGGGLGFNNLLFDSSSDVWNVVAFWAYCAFGVGIVQLVKAFTVKD